MKFFWAHFSLSVLSPRENMMILYKILESKSFCVLTAILDYTLLFYIPSEVATEQVYFSFSCLPF